MKKLIVCLCLIACQLNAANWLPDPKLTPGEVDPTVTLEMLRSPAFIKSRRNVPISEKKAIFRLYGVPWSERAHYEVDHYLPLCLGGKNSRANLWLEWWDGPFGAHTKDRLEMYLHRQSLKGTITLKEAQSAFLDGPWTNALAKYNIKVSGTRNALFKLTHRAVK